MHIRKSLIFIVGLAVGVVAMAGFSYLDTKGASGVPEVAQTEIVARAAAPVSPFTVVDEPQSTAVTDMTPDTGFGDAEVLIQRIEAAENRIEALEADLAEVRLRELLPGDNPTEEEQTEILSSIFEPATVAEIQAIRDDNQLQRLELRDQAIREGWINTDRFRDESNALRDGRQLRETLGDEGYDKLLVAEGRDNRVRIESVIENSAADLSGIEVGDTIIRYADDRVFQFRDLRGGTTGGVRNESVSIQVNRNGELIDLVIPRGPMGVTLTGVTEPPLSQ